MSTVTHESSESLDATLLLNGKALALVCGLIGGLGLFVATNWLVLKGGPPDNDGEPLVGPHLSLLGQYFVGYDVSFAGSIVGFVWAFAVCAASSFLVSVIYNRLAVRGESP